MEAFTEYGPVWILVGVLVTAHIKLVYTVVKLVENNTASLQKLTDVVSGCNKKHT